MAIFNSYVTFPEGKVSLSGKTFPELFPLLDGFIRAAGFVT